MSATPPDGSGPPPGTWSPPGGDAPTPPPPAPDPTPSAPPPGPGPTPPPPTGPSAPPPPGYGQAEVYRYGQAPSVALPRAGYGSRALAFLLDSAVVGALPAAALVVLRTGPREVRGCDLTASGDIAVFGQEGVTRGICEVPTAGTIAVAGVLAVLGAVAWLLYVAWEGRTGAALGKRATGLRTVDIGTAAPIGAGRSIGRNLLRGLGLLFAGIPFLVDHLWPLWDRRGQTIHDKAVSTVVVPATAVPTD